MRTLKNLETSIYTNKHSEVGSGLRISVIANNSEERFKYYILNRPKYLVRERFEESSNSFSSSSMYDPNFVRDVNNDEKRLWEYEYEYSNRGRTYSRKTFHSENEVFMYLLNRKHYSKDDCLSETFGIQYKISPSSPHYSLDYIQKYLERGLQTHIGMESMFELPRILRVSNKTNETIEYSLSEFRKEYDKKLKLNTLLKNSKEKEKYTFRFIGSKGNKDFTYRRFLEILNGTLFKVGSDSSEIRNNAFFTLVFNRENYIRFRDELSYIDGSKNEVWLYYTIYTSSNPESNYELNREKVSEFFEKYSSYKGTFESKKHKDCFVVKLIR